ncbi:DUF3710 domain-containing protein [Nocardioides sp. Bht2]|uniref:DUF3710 domain-containing protein n=1 Tax=Nocardioides sp. Bht2 TaxID=3392297 RepID=UPI0039B6DBAC
MKFGRKAKATNLSATEAEKSTVDTETGGAASEPIVRTGPRDIAAIDVENDHVGRVDLGGFLLAPADGLELRLQVSESDGVVQSVLLANDQGAVEIRAFAAPRDGDLWSDVRRQMAAETSRQGGTATEREGSQGTELYCEMTVQTPDGRTGTQPSRVVGFNGPRWFLRATYLGVPAMQPEAADLWESAVNNVVVRRGDGPMAPGDALPVTLPPQARRVGPAEE